MFSICWVECFFYINLIHLNFTLYVIAKLLKIVIITSIIQYHKKEFKKSLSERGSISTVYVFKGSLKGYDKLSSLCFLYVSVNSLSLTRSWRNKFDNWSALCCVLYNISPRIIIYSWGYVFLININQKKDVVQLVLLFSLQRFLCNY
jgi:hypothetical protein